MRGTCERRRPAGALLGAAAVAEAVTGALAPRSGPARLHLLLHVLRPRAAPLAPRLHPLPGGPGHTREAGARAGGGGGGEGGDRAQGGGGGRDRDQDRDGDGDVVLVVVVVGAGVLGGEGLGHVMLEHAETVPQAAEGGR